MTLLYLQVSAVGIIYIWTLFSAFGVNVFDFAEANDFLLAAFKEPFAYLIAILTVFVLSIEVLILRLRRGRPWPPRLIKLLLIILIPTFIAYTILPPWYYARKNARKLIKSKSGLVDLCLKGKPEEVKRLFPEGHVSIIGTTEKFAFFYAHDSKRSVVIPISNIGSISIAVKNK